MNCWSMVSVVKRCPSRQAIAIEDSAIETTGIVSASLRASMPTRPKPASTRAAGVEREQDQVSPSGDRYVDAVDLTLRRPLEHSGHPAAPADDDIPARRLREAAGAPRRPEQSHPMRTARQAEARRPYCFWRSRMRAASTRESPRARLNASRSRSPRANARATRSAAVRASTAPRSSSRRRSSTLFIASNYSKCACSVHHRHDLDLDELLGLAQLQHRDVGRRGLVVERAEVRVDDAGGLADVAHARAGARAEGVHDVLEAGAGRFTRLLDAVHRGLRLCL